MIKTLRVGSGQPRKVSPGNYRGPGQEGDVETSDIVPAFEILAVEEVYGFRLALRRRHSRGLLGWLIGRAWRRAQKAHERCEGKDARRCEQARAFHRMILR